jgi:hypothetical protein
MIDFVCASQSDAVTCGVLPSGRWKCTCGVGIDGRTVELTGISGPDACLLGAGLCRENELDLGEEDCVELFPYSTVDTCSLQLSCGRPIVRAYPPGVSAWLTTYDTGTCQREQADLPFSCSCVTGAGTVEHRLLAESGAEACRPLLDFCHSGEEPEFGDDPTCVEEYATDSRESCSVGLLCYDTMSLTSDVRLARVEQHSGQCARMEEGGSRCSCARPDPESPDHQIFHFDVEQNVAAETCAAAVLDCAWDAELVPLGPATCEPELSAFSADSCGIYLNCRQPATVDGREVVSMEGLILDCQRPGSGSPWACGCASGANTAIFELGSPELDPQGACAAAPARCQEELSVYLGPAVDPMVAPDPLP